MTEMSPTVAEDDCKRQCNSCKVFRLPTHFLGAKGQVVKSCNKCREKNKNRSHDKPDIIVEENGEKIKCTSCKLFRSSSDFIGKRGNTVNTCIKCREKDDRQKKKPDVKAKRNELQREKQYYKDYRERKRNENEDEYLKHNKEVAKIWRDNNKEHYSEWKRNNYANRINSTKRQAKSKGYIWTMNDDDCKQMIAHSCFYCNTSSTDGLHGIDRMDNTKGYILENCVGCCETCNFMKKSLDAHTFVERCIHIATCFDSSEIKQTKFPSAWKQSNSSSFNDYKRRANKKALNFDITKEDYQNLVQNKCYYCHRESNESHKNGIDRVDNTKGYSLDNCVTCCFECNAMKTDLDKKAFIDKCIQVAKHVDLKSLPPMPRCYSVVAKRNNTKED